jgi:hypothetical protein
MPSETFKMKIIAIIALSLALIGGMAQVKALTILIDYTYSSTTEGFFANSEARAAVEAAAADISALLSPTQLSAISPSGSPNVNAITGSSGTSSISADFYYEFNDPSGLGPDPIYLDDPLVPANVVRIYVGAQPLSGNVLGEGGSAGVGAFFGSSIGGSGYAAAVDAMEAVANTYMGRGAGPTIGTLIGTVGSGGNTQAFSIGYGVGIGSMTFDNDGSTTWHYNHTSAPAANTSDLYSVALHEILHVLGVGASETWDENVNGTQWGGPSAGISVTGTLADGSPAGTNIIDPGGYHLIDGLRSWTLGIGVGAPTSSLQEVAMDPTLTNGTRKFLTALDAAILSDLGYTTIIPEPSRALLLLLGFTLLQFRRQR